MTSRRPDHEHDEHLPPDDDEHEEGEDKGAEEVPAPPPVGPPAPEGDHS
jgi:hypothetical protein